MKRPLIFALTFSLASTSIAARAADLKITAKDYDQAESAENYFKFIGHSKKLGIIGSHFEGYARNADLSFDKKDSRYENAKLIIDVSQLDTDNGSRNEKMREKCLSYKEYPQVVITLKAPVDSAKDSQDIPAEMLVRGNTVPLTLHVEKKGEGDFLGESSFKLSEAKIPDPSIVIASVDDEFKLEFRVHPEEAQ